MIRHNFPGQKLSIRGFACLRLLFKSQNYFRTYDYIINSVFLISPKHNLLDHLALVVSSTSFIKLIFGTLLKNQKLWTTRKVIKLYRLELKLNQFLNILFHKIHKVYWNSNGWRFWNYWSRFCCNSEHWFWSIMTLCLNISLDWL